MPIYETVYVLRPDLSKSQVEQINEDYLNIIKADAVKVGRQEYWGMRNLAYRIRKQRKGHYLLINYESGHAIVNEVERKMRLNEDVLRYMTIKLEEMPTEASPMMKMMDEDDYSRRPRRRYDDDRGARGGDRDNRRDDRGPRDDRGARDTRDGDNRRDDRGDRDNRRDDRRDNTRDNRDSKADDNNQKSDDKGAETNAPSDNTSKE